MVIHLAGDTSRKKLILRPRIEGQVVYTELVVQVDGKDTSILVEQSSLLAAAKALYEEGRGR